MGLVEFNRTVLQGEEGVVTAQAHVGAGVKTGAALPYDDGAGRYDLATETWSEFDDEGWIGRQVHAIATRDGDPQRIITVRGAGYRFSVRDS